MGVVNKGEAGGYLEGLVEKDMLTADWEAKGTKLQTPSPGRTRPGRGFPERLSASPKKSAGGKVEVGVQLPAIDIPEAGPTAGGTTGGGTPGGGTTGGGVTGGGTAGRGRAANSSAGRGDNYLF